jgi:hypothetical protein
MRKAIPLPVMVGAICALGLTVFVMALLWQLISPMQ